MGQIVALIVILIMALFLFLPMFNLVENHYEVTDVKQRLVLSSKVLINSIQKEDINQSKLMLENSDRFGTEIIVDRDKLLSSFYDMVHKNFPNKNKREKVLSNIKAKILVEHNRLYYASDEDIWGLPTFFMHNYSDEIVYLSIKNSLAYIYNNDNTRVYKETRKFGISNEDKEQIIIDKINEVVAKHTFQEGMCSILSINIRNKHTEDIYKKMIEANFNVLEGITFFIVYSDEVVKKINNEEFIFKNYNVVGTTIEQSFRD
ncbi:MAG: hypothetical protein LR001_00785 [Clostridiales bacterium]|nr:hypothetical protein [Clostridiales bacterium]